ncbi:MAG: hydantoinase/oxoprolinase family protein [Streptosporangiales bacterium]|nr:hydantoinase/oxoprolinase family protein [Streptosporangiales bacterium]
MRIGIDVGGTNTDAVLMSGNEIRATAKTVTTGDVTSGILVALDRLQAGNRFSPQAIDAVIVGTTHFTNALAEGRDLAPIAVVRLGLPATAALPPLVGWPGRLVRAIGGRRFVCRGGNEFDGRPIAAIEEDELRRVAADIGRAGVRSVAISSVFSLPYDECERRAAEILTREIPSIQVSLSHEIGRLGLLGRENATVINACLRDLVDRVADALVSAMHRAGLSAPLFLTQNDGTVMDLEYARRFPVATFASGPANSMRGAAFLSGHDDCLVVDVGGTTTDVGVLAGGFPRAAPGEVMVAGVRTNFRMPQLASAPVGGGSLVRQEDGRVTVGPLSVGQEITRRALVFGGDTITASDLAAAAGLADIGDSRLAASLDAGLVGQGLDTFANRALRATRRLRTSPDPVPVVLVGGGSPLLTDRLAEVGPVYRPEHYEVANAIGAATTWVGGEVDRVFPVGPGERDQVLELARSEAHARAVAAGAKPDTVEIAEVHESPLSYLPGNATRVRVRALGGLPVTGSDVTGSEACERSAEAMDGSDAGYGDG